MHVYLIRKVVSVKECNQDYVVDGVPCNKVRSQGSCDADPRHHLRRRHEGDRPELREQQRAEAGGLPSLRRRADAPRREADDEECGLSLPLSLSGVQEALRAHEGAGDEDADGEGHDGSAGASPADGRCLGDDSRSRTSTRSTRCGCRATCGSRRTSWRPS